MDCLRQRVKLGSSILEQLNVTDKDVIAATFGSPFCFVLKVRRWPN